jgi:hypothetical protein
MTQPTPASPPLVVNPSPVAPVALPDWLAEAFPEAVAAMRDGSRWEYAPESVEVGEWHPWRCDDNDCGAEGGWHGEWTCLGYSIEDGVLYDDMWTCDTDGNWDVSCEPHDPSRGDELHREAQEAYRAYARWVAENGRDPLGEFSMFSSRRVEQRWQFRCEQVEGPVTVTGVRRNGRGAWLPLSDAPSTVRDFLDVGSFLDLDALREGAHGVRWHGRLATPDVRVGTFTLETQAPPSAATVRREVVRRARRVLDERV